MARKVRIDMTGLRYGRLVGIGYSHTTRGKAHWLFSCDCGREVIVQGTAVRLGNTSSCGCLHREICAARLTVHGWRAEKHHDATYRAWQAMNDACFNPRSPKYRDCGKFGIGVSPEWRSDFTAFLADMGGRPDGAILDRIDEEGDFTPENCRWIDVSPRSARATAGWERRRISAPQ